MDEYSSLQNELDLYLNFFKRRAELSVEYSEGLRKMALKQQDLDRRFDEEERQLDNPTWKQAYVDIRSNLLEEASAQGQFAEKTRKLVDSLTEFKNRKDRTRRRIKDDVRTTTTEHSDYKSAVMKLRKAYEHKVDEVKNHEEAEQQHDAWPPEHWQPSTEGGSDPRRISMNSSRGSDRDSPPLSSVSATSSGSSPTGPTGQVFVSGATSTAPTAPSAYRDAPSAKSPNVFDQLTKRDWTGDKHRVNSIVRAVGNLAKGGDPSVGIKPSSVKGAKSRLAAGKLKREAEQADRDYRDSIFRLETLRLQRDRIHRSAITSLREFAFELSDILRDAFQRHMEDLEIVSCNTIALVRNTLTNVERIDAEQDATTISSRFRDQEISEPPVYYQNAFVGECRTLLFGVSLTDYLSTHPNQFVPLIVKNCIVQIEATGSHCEGIYRIPGKLATVQQLVHKIEKDEVAFSFDSRVDPAAVAGVLKLYLRQLPTPLFPFPLNDRLAFSEDFMLDPETHLASLTRRIRRLSAPQQATLKALCGHLAKVASREQENKMTTSNLGLVFSPVVFGEDEGKTIESVKHSAKDAVMELLIIHQATLFVGLPIEPPVVVRSRQGSLSDRPGLQAPQQQSNHQHTRSTSSIVTTPPRPRRTSSASPSTAISHPPRQTSEPLLTTMSTAAPTIPQPVFTPVSPPVFPTDSIYNHYQATAPDSSIPQFSPFDDPDSLDSPTPPLSAAGGRRIPNTPMGAVRSSSGSGPTLPLPEGWDGASSPAVGSSYGTSPAYQ